MWNWTPVLCYRNPTIIILYFYIFTDYTGCICLYISLVYDYIGDIISLTISNILLVYQMLHPPSITIV